MAAGVLWETPTTQADIGATLSGEVFGTLINLSGQRRFTSQRLTLYAVLASQKYDDAKYVARKTQCLFREAHSVLVDGNGHLPGFFCEVVQLVYFGSLQGNRAIRDFISHDGRTLQALEIDSSRPAGRPARRAGTQGGAAIGRAQ